MAEILVLCIGNDARGDDGAGRAAARALQGALPAGATLVELSGEAVDILAQLENVERVFIVDACFSGARPGALHRFDVSAAPLPQEGFSLSSHGLGLHDALELARALGALPPLCVVHAIEGVHFEIGAGISPAVAAGARQAAARVLEDLAALLEQETKAHA